MSEKLKNSNHNRKGSLSRAHRKRWWRKIHRLIGICSVVFLLVLSVTGIMLNHIDEWFDGNQYVSNQMLLDWYSIQAPKEVISLNPKAMEPRNFYWADNQLFLAQTVISSDTTKPLASFLYDSLLYVVTKTSVEILTFDGEYVERIPTPETISSCAVRGKTLQVVGKKAWQLDLNELEFSRLDPDLASLLQANLQGSIEVRDATSDQALIVRQHRLLQSKVLQDVHSGRILGPWGVILFDVFAVLFVALSVSGILLWSRGISAPRN